MSSAVPPPGDQPSIQFTRRPDPASDDGGASASTSSTNQASAQYTQALQRAGLPAQASNVRHAGPNTEITLGDDHEMAGDQVKTLTAWMNSLGMNQSYPAILEGVEHSEGFNRTPPVSFQFNDDPSLKGFDVYDTYKVTAGDGTEHTLTVKSKIFTSTNDFGEALTATNTARAHKRFALNSEFREALNDTQRIAVSTSDYMKVKMVRSGGTFATTVPGQAAAMAATAAAAASQAQGAGGEAKIKYDSVKVVYLVVNGTIDSRPRTERDCNDEARRMLQGYNAQAAAGAHPGRPPQFSTVAEKDLIADWIRASEELHGESRRRPARDPVQYGQLRPDDHSSTTTTTTTTTTAAASADDIDDDDDDD